MIEMLLCNDVVNDACLYTLSSNAKDENHYSDNMTACSSCSSLVTTSQDELSSNESEICYQTYVSPVNRKKPRRSVGFSHIQVREYELELGDNPSCAYGPPLTFSWEHCSDNTIDIDDYESNRYERRTLRQMHLNASQRRNILIWCAGYSENDIKMVERDVKTLRTKRWITNKMLPARKIEEAIQSVRRKVNRRSVRSEGLSAEV